MNEIEKAAREWLEDYGQMTDHINDYIDAFKAGYNHALRMSDKGFHDFWISGMIPDHRGIGNGYTSPAAMAVTNRKIAASFVWNQAKLSCAKELAEKDKEIQEFKNDLKVFKNDHWFMINLIERYGSDKDQTLIDIHERMVFRQPIFRKHFSKES